MCIVTEHVKLLKENEELKTKIAGLEAGNLEWYELNQPASTKQIISTDLYKFLWRHFGDTPFFIGDRYRYLCNYDDIAVFLAQDQTNKMEYVSDTEGISSYDCNVFANRLMGQFSVPGWCDLTFGKIWLKVPAHALNLIITETEEIFYVEPQNDELMSVDKYDSKEVRFIEM